MNLYHILPSLAAYTGPWGTCRDSPFARIVLSPLQTSQFRDHFYCNYTHGAFLVLPVVPQVSVGISYLWRRLTPPMSEPCLLLISDTKQPHKVFPGTLTSWHQHRHQSPSRKFPPVFITPMKRTTKPPALVMLGHNKFHTKTGAALKFLRILRCTWKIGYFPLLQGTMNHRELLEI